MITIKVLGTGCANCKTTLKLIEEVAAEKRGRYTGHYGLWCY